MRLHDTRPQDETEGTRVFRGHDYGTRGSETPERPFIPEQDPIDGFFHRVRSWVRSIAR